MERIYTYDKKNSERVVTLSQNSGLYFASNPVNITINIPPRGLTITGIWSVAADIEALDSVSDEIGITHEDAEGEVAEASNDE